MFFFLVMLGFLVFSDGAFAAMGVEDVVTGGLGWCGKRAWSAMEVVDGNGAGGWHSLAVYGYPMRMSLVRWVVYGCFFFGLIATLKSRRRINVTVSFVAGHWVF